MAFDHPLEADRVDDLNLLSAIIRVPIVGGLMWLVAGGDMEKKEQEEKNRELHKSMMASVVEDDEAGGGGDAGPDAGPDETEPLKLPRQSNSSGCLKSSLKRESPLPKLVNSELSVSSGYYSGESAADGATNRELDGICTSESQEPLSKLESKKKRMSWSDSLVEYMDESLKHEPPSSADMSKPVKSAMTRTTSIRTNALHEHQQEDSKRYLPKGMDRVHSGIIMPTRPLGQSSSGVESPQWGWYINTTPPTPEMYHTQSSLTMHQKKYSDISTTTMQTAESSVADVSAESRLPTARPNRVFQGLKDANKTPMGWPSVPL